ncbi:hypothetical protein pdam_00010019 [Pocillopora damicornis]|uniref:Uncharacterized protein n=1 Tax=Pocillopora damicornis TaxID=46731 RepID=A0A3M6T568_POCDA|nr:hypothetical protein pdam_00010019 [Pocillopora damicornis]
MAITTYVRFKVTICLYLSPSTKARSLSTLIAVIVKIDTEQMTANKQQKKALKSKRYRDQLLRDNDTGVWMADEEKIPSARRPG